MSQYKRWQQRQFRLDVQRKHPQVQDWHETPELGLKQANSVR